MLFLLLLRVWFSSNNGNIKILSHHPLQAFHEEYCRLYELSQEEATPQEDARLQHALVYFFQNNAPKRIIERTLLEQFTDRNLSFDERYKSRIIPSVTVDTFLQFLY